MKAGPEEKPAPRVRCAGPTVPPNPEKTEDGEANRPAVLFVYTEIHRYSK